MSDPRTSSPSTRCSTTTSATSATRYARSPRRSSCPTSRSGTRRARCPTTSPRSSASSGCSACTSRATAARARARRLRPGLPRARGRRLGRAQPRVGAGVAGDVRDPALGHRGAEAGVAAADGGRRGDRLLRPDRARRGQRPRLDADPRAPRRRRLGAQRPKMWITNGIVADVAVVWAQTDDGHPRASSSRPTRPGFTAQEIHRSCRCGPRSPPSSCSTRCGCPAGACSPRSMASRAAVVPQRGPFRDPLGCRGRGPRLLRGGARVLARARSSSAGRSRRSSSPRRSSPNGDRGEQRTLVAVQSGGIKDAGSCAGAGQPASSATSARRSRSRAAPAPCSAPTASPSSTR